MPLDEGGIPAGLLSASVRAPGESFEPSLPRPRAFRRREPRVFFGAFWTLGSSTLKHNRRKAASHGCKNSISSPSVSQPSSRGEAPIVVMENGCSILGSRLCISLKTSRMGVSCRVLIEIWRGVPGVSERGEELDTCTAIIRDGSLAARPLA